MLNNRSKFSLTPIAAGVIAITSLSFGTAAEAEVKLLSRVVNGPISVTGQGDTAAYEFLIQTQVVNTDLDTGTPAPVPASIQLADPLKNIEDTATSTTIEVISGPMVVPGVTVPCVEGCKTTTDGKKIDYNTQGSADFNSGFTGAKSGTGAEVFAATAKINPYSSLTFMYKVRFKPGTKESPFLFPVSLGGTQTAVFFLPEESADRLNVCPAGKVPSNAINLVKNGNFTIPQGNNPATVDPGGQIAGTFKSDFKYEGDNNDFTSYNHISMATGNTITAKDISQFQYPFPGTKKDGDLPAVAAASGYLRGAGPKPAEKTGEFGLANPSAAWIQTVTGLDPNATYQFEAWISNLAPIKEAGVVGEDPEIVLVAGSNESTVKKLYEDSKTDKWHPIAMAVEKPTQSSLKLEIKNKHVLGTNPDDPADPDNAGEANYNLFAVTAIGFRKCVDPADVDKKETAPGGNTGGGSPGGGAGNGNGNPGGPSGNAPGNNGQGGTGDPANGSGTTTSGGGGGGALGMALAGIGLLGLRRRRH